MNQATYQYIDLSYLEEMSFGDAELKKTMLGMLFEEVPTELTKMRNLVAAQRWDELASVSHKMKSTVSFVGNDALTEANKEIEHACKTGTNTAQIPGWMVEVERQFERSMPELRSVHAAL